MTAYYTIILAEPEAWPPLALEAWHARQTGPYFSSTRLVGTEVEVLQPGAARCLPAPCSWVTG